MVFNLDPSYKTIIYVNIFFHIRWLFLYIYLLEQCSDRPTNMAFVSAKLSTNFLHLYGFKFGAEEEKYDLVKIT